MNYEILIGNKVTLDGKTILVEKIEKAEDVVGRSVYSINGAGQYTKFDIGMQVTLLTNKLNENKHGFFGRLKAKFGLFVLKDFHDLILGDEIGFRRYGYHVCSFFVSITILGYKYHAEFVWNDKEEFTNAKMPEFNPLKQVF